MDDKNNQKVRPRSKMGTGIAIGMGVGVAIGVATDNIAVGIAVGVAIGVAIGAAWDNQTRNKNDNLSTSCDPQGKVIYELYELWRSHAADAREAAFLL
ncbi:MAG: hypothetical protein WBD62_14400 [Anaerolineales bacterium]